MGNNFLDLNREHYNTVYGEVNIPWIVETVRDYKNYLDEVIKYRTSWATLYTENFRQQLVGKRILELGAGNGLNALIMACLGAQVVALDISEESERVINQAARELGLSQKVEAYSGDFRDMSFVQSSFDFVVGKAFLHHLPHDIEEEYVGKIADLLLPTGEARFAEPAINSIFLDKLRWMVPIPTGRPSILNKNAFAVWKETDPHPVRDHSSHHYIQLGRQFFGDVDIFPIGGIQRFHRFLPKGKLDQKFRKIAFRIEEWLPHEVKWKIARAQTIIFRNPKPAVLNYFHEK